LSRGCREDHRRTRGDLPLVVQDGCAAAAVLWRLARPGEGPFTMERRGDQWFGGWLERSVVSEIHEQQAIPVTFIEEPEHETVRPEDCPVAMTAFWVTKE